MAQSAAFINPSSVVITGGWNATTKSTTSTCVAYDVVSNSFKDLPSLPFACLDAAEIGFFDGGVLVAGGKTVKSNVPGSVDLGAMLKPQAP